MLSHMRASRFVLSAFALLSAATLLLTGCMNIESWVRAIALTRPLPAITHSCLLVSDDPMFGEILAGAVREGIKHELSTDLPMCTSAAPPGKSVLKVSFSIEKRERIITSGLPNGYSFVIGTRIVYDVNWTDERHGNALYFRYFLRSRTSQADATHSLVESQESVIRRAGQRIAALVSALSVPDEEVTGRYRSLDDEDDKEFEIRRGSETGTFEGIVVKGPEWMVGKRHFLFRESNSHSPVRDRNFAGTWFEINKTFSATWAGPDVPTHSYPADTLLRGRLVMIAREVPWASRQFATYHLVKIGPAIAVSDPFRR